MPDRIATTAERPLSLIERKQHAARNRIIDAADVLFAQRGFDSVSVTDIAELAEVGRTTFFRYFSGKTEVIFAKEQRMFDAITEVASEAWAPDRSVDSLADAVRALEPLVIRLCEHATADLGSYTRHMALVEGHEELRAREALKHQAVAGEFANVLVTHDVPVAIAIIAAQLAVACYSSGRALAAAPGDLVARTREAFQSTLAISTIRTTG